MLSDLGLPRAQQNERAALTLLALLNLRTHQNWSEATSPMIGITPIMDWVREHYSKSYAPNSRETFRRQTMHQFVQAGLVRYNPDKPDRAVKQIAIDYLGFTIPDLFVIGYGLDYAQRYRNLPFIGVLE